MSQQLIFEGMTGRIVETQVIHEFSDEDFIRKISELVPLTAGPFPHNTVFYQTRSENGQVYQTYGIERLPGLYDHKYLPKGTSQEHIKVFKIWLPHLIWWVSTINNTIDKVYLTGADNPRWDGPSTKLYYLPLNNQYQPAGNFCCGNLSLDATKPLVVNIERAIMHLEDSLWNDDLQAVFNGCSIRNLGEWAEESKKDKPELKFVKYPQPTVSKMCKWIAKRLDNIGWDPEATDGGA